ncbi:50S ribosomal protein L25/general stress protein Ctc [Caldibacillus debilis]|jgi:large subunit ribosomal protein L25|uniref:Large ribosomal subunit protein bL25 n=1 Tax=Caldibacillus debilis GB1 TaxID=1339248 RepID=A0A420VIS9_9BACI|nr:50S ribosomal protein L25/general stress protein Ctc [Caldibacillus debilis]MBY6271167.1 50S ribosomal protein L25 [Bacillaceae bacterium]REJ23757.1 MAG: 50S ribosomal protein L25 [Caldibacillus debilis]RKO63278.1 LSU ribosomal protein L25P [Caldibacillus debilis GB1]
METVLTAKRRTDLRKSATNRLRREGYIPGVLYGKEAGNIPIYVSKGEFLKTVSKEGRNRLLNLEVDGKKWNVLIQETQEHPLKKELIHVDFFAVDLSAEIRTEVPVVLTGEPVGTKQGGILQQVLFEMEITTKANEIPNAIEVDVSHLDIDDTVVVGDVLDRYKKYKIHHEPDEVIATLLPPEDTGAEETEAEAADAGAAEGEEQPSDES